MQVKWSDPQEHYNFTFLLTSTNDGRWFKQELFKVHPVQFGALPAAAEQLFTKPRSQPKIEPNFEACSWLFLKKKPQI